MPSFNKHITVNSPHVKFDEALNQLNVDYEYSHTKANRLAGGLINVSVHFVNVLIMVQAINHVIL